jgi:type VI protein secretion system component VasF
MFNSSGMTSEEYKRLPRWLKIAYWCIMVTAVALITSVWLGYLG